MSVRKRAANRLSTKIALLTIPILLTTACAGGGTGPSGAAGPTKIGFAQGNFGNGWYEVNAKGATDEAKQLGHDLEVVSGGGDPVTQNAQLSNFITKGVAGLIINPTDPQALSSNLSRLKDEKIPFVLVNAGVTPDLLADSYCYVTEDEKVNAGLVGAETARVMKAKHGATKPVKILLVLGFPGDTNSANREAGFKAGYASVAGAPPAQYLENVYGKWAADTAVAPVSSVATGNPDLDAMFVGTDSMLPGVQQALTSVNMWGKVSIASYDGQMKVVKQMKDDPNSPVIATVANLPAQQGMIAAQMLDKALKGEDKNTACPGNKFFVKPTLITHDNAASYYKSDADY
ncbi:ribose ABC transporter substrate-binding protein RbsB [Arthrobacter gyeryongensis]|uniref:Ribose ABC transporter substrate-binding protein RbsB n=1 Tax=Arthrobacter gyeryongensis TaxID=1650592 RepID=A0ABP9SVH3_9MICC